MSPDRPDRPPDRWLVLQVALPDDEDTRDLWIEELLALDSRGVEERPGGLVVYLPPPDRGLAELVSDLQVRLAEVGSGRKPDSVRIEAGWQPHEAWEERWRSHFRARRVTGRITVAPSWDRPTVDPGGILVEIDPGMAFGTSDHPTTRACLRLLEGLVEVGQRVADVGAGSGILGITAALLGADSVLALELDPWACRAARENAERNAVADRVSVRAGPVTPEGLPAGAPFDGIVANMESGILRPLLPALRSALAPGGWLILSGILRSESEEIRESAVAAGLALQGTDVEDEWWSAAFSAASRPRPEPARWQERAPGGEGAVEGPA